MLSSSSTEEAIERIDDPADRPQVDLEQDHPWRDEATLRALYADDGLSRKEIADLLGCSPPTVTRWRKELDIPPRSGGGTSTATGVDPHERCREVVDERAASIGEAPRQRFMTNVELSREICALAGVDYDPARSNRNRPIFTVDQHAAIVRALLPDDFAYESIDPHPFRECTMSGPEDLTHLDREELIALADRGLGAEHDVVTDTYRYVRADLKAIHRVLEAEYGDGGGGEPS